MVSEHFHPWTPQQGQSGFAWAFMGALGQRTSLRFGTAVTCPGFRYHPAVIAHAAATLGAMYPGRFYLGLGAGEALNEHVIAPVWPEVPIRSAMMFEAIEVISKLFSGDVVRHDGKYFTLERAKLYTRPPDDQRVPIYVATAGPVNAKKTGKFADGLITVGAADEKMEMIWGKFEEGRARGRQGRPAARSSSRSTSRGRAPTRRRWRTPWSSGPTAAWRSSPSRTSRTPRTSPGIAKLVRPEDFKNRVMISSDLEAHARHIQHYVDMGYDEIHLHNVGRNQAEFIEVFGREVLPNLRLG